MNSDDKGSIYLVFEYLEHDLAGLMDLRYDTMFRMESIKCFMKQLLEGLYALHHNKIIHRDIKASNLLVSNEGVLKIADFGLARPHLEEPWHYTANVITLWYRPPEVLLATEEKRKSVVYSTYVDMWSAGCILAEMLFRAPLFKGRTETELLDGIFKVLGTPTRQRNPELWPDLSALAPVPQSNPNGLPNPSLQHGPPNPDGSLPTQPPKQRVTSYDIWKRWKEPATIHPPKLKQMCDDHKLPPQTYELLSSLLAYDPEKRMTAKTALDHDWFWDEPLPCSPAEIGSCPPSNELLAKKHKEEERKKAAMAHNNRVASSGVQAQGVHGGVNQGHAGHAGHGGQGHPGSHGHGHSHPHGPPSNNHPQSSNNHHHGQHRPTHHHPHQQHAPVAKPAGISGFAGPAKNPSSSSSYGSKPPGAYPGSAPPTAKYVAGPPKYAPPPGSGPSAHQVRYATSAGSPPSAGARPGGPSPISPPSMRPHPPGSKPPPPSSTPPPSQSGMPHRYPSASSPPSSSLLPQQQPSPSLSSQQRAAPSAAQEGNATHYPPSSGFLHNSDNTNKRYKTEESNPVSGSH